MQVAKCCKRWVEKKAEFKLYGSDPDYVNLNAIEEKKQAKRFKKC